MLRRPAAFRFCSSPAIGSIQDSDPAWFSGSVLFPSNRGDECLRECRECKQSMFALAFKTRQNHDHFQTFHPAYAVPEAFCIPTDDHKSSNKT